MMIFVTNPVILMIITVFIGLILGKIKFGRFSFSTSGSMFIGIVVGWSVVTYINTIESGSEFYQVAQDVLAKR
jgi:putative transport protein